jgi:hypothetical protein
VRDGETRLLVSPRDPRALATAIGRLGDDRAHRTRLAAAGPAPVPPDNDHERAPSRYPSRFAEPRG